MDNDEKIRRDARMLYKVEIVYRNGTETKLCRLKNLLPSEFENMRERMFVAGFKHKDTEVRGHGWIIPPFDIVSIEYFIQDKFIEP